MKKAGLVSIGIAGLMVGVALLDGKKRMLDQKTPVDEDAPGIAPSMGLINELDETVQHLALSLLRAAHALGIELIVTQAYRSMDEQAHLYAQGRTIAGPIVTNAPPGSSWHEFRKAFDVAILKDGRATWPNDVALWQRIGNIGKQIGLDWGGDFHTIIDRPHFEYHPGQTLAMARAMSANRNV